MARHYYTQAQRECKISVWCERARISLALCCEVLALFYYSFLYLICRHCCCFSVLFHRRDEVYFETKTIFFSRDFVGAARADTTDYCRALFLCAPQNFAAKSNRGFCSRSPVLFGYIWGLGRITGFFGAAGRRRCFKQLCFKPPFISSFCALSRAALSPHH